MLSDKQAQRLKVKFEEKKADADRRMIDFDFTLEEFTHFWIAKNNKGRCAYTNVVFVNEENHPLIPTLERIDNTKGYNPNNCVYVTYEANKLKEKFIEQKHPAEEAMLTNGEQHTLLLIRRVLSKSVYIERVQEPYKKVLTMYRKRKQKENKQKESLDKPEQIIHNQPQEVKEENEMSNITIKNINPELNVAQQYIEIGQYFESKGLEFNLTFSKFKQKIKIKNCQLTKKPFEEGCKKVLFVVDKTKPITYDNVLTTHHSTMQVFDHIESVTKLSMVELKTALNAIC